MILAHLLAAVLTAGPSAPPAQLVAALPSCSPDQLSWDIDTEGGRFDGMSQSGALLVVRNVGVQPCRTPALPPLRLEDAAGRTLAAARRAPRGMHPGPVVLPVALAPEAEATAALHWVQGDVYEGHNCISAARVRIGAATVALSGHICGPAGQPVPYDQPPLRTDPILTPRS